MRDLVCLTFCWMWISSHTPMCFYPAPWVVILFTVSAVKCMKRSRGLACTWFLSLLCDDICCFWKYIFEINSHNIRFTCFKYQTQCFFFKSIFTTLCNHLHYQMTDLITIFDNSKRNLGPISSHCCSARLATLAGKSTSYLCRVARFGYSVLDASCNKWSWGLASFTKKVL